MKMRKVAAGLFGVVAFGVGVTLLFTQAKAQVPPREASAEVDRGKLRARVVTLRTEVEMARLDYEIAREALLEELKIIRGLRMAEGMFGMMSAFQSAENPAEQGDAPKPEQVKKNETEEARKAELERKKAEEEEAASLAEAKKTLSRLYSTLSEIRLDLEDAEREYVNRTQ